ncbi:hypothetical protein TTHERM_000013239 (macronuclear) [Tetrahymena thermophila SB210]|uniref:Uncharacterized protein n=1 Tax=Tetrahymena thermophila (strain SB210) TaxID=312017 RepID=W7XEY3_TETTS|nr:hypothetical protein TTHERM_000013239 [Tetrahymena thermophila SB210]EWS76347.1 hypothetical protein TTHERM_000013239 [Tetrahymena thermophila SB210]|eukprot:XP_012651131.1 hypothetical protein TTHERM_000013239 [Tetrahymena thermophila SB210]
MLKIVFSIHFKFMRKEFILSSSLQKKEIKNIKNETRYIEPFIYIFPNKIQARFLFEIYFIRRVKG